MALVKKIITREKRNCQRCKKEIQVGDLAIKDRRSRYKKTKEKIERSPDKPTEYYHTECYEKAHIH